MRVNVNKRTGISFGFVSADLLNSELVGELLSEGEDLSFKEFTRELENSLDLDTDVGQASYDEAVEFYECDEPTIEGVRDGTSYATSWLGGALNFFVYESPYTATVALCSPCVPGAGDLGSSGPYECYSITPDWWDEYGINEDPSEASDELVEIYEKHQKDILELIHSMMRIGDEEVWINFKGDLLLQFYPGTESVEIYRDIECQDYVVLTSKTFAHIWS